MLTAFLAAAAIAAGPAIPERLARIDTAGSSAELAAGRAGKLVVTVLADGTAEAPTHLELQFPIRMSLEPTAGLAVAKPKLAKADAVKLDKREIRFEAPLQATAAGAQQVKVRIDYAVCLEDPKTGSTLVCLPQKKELVHAVAVK